MNLNTPSTKTFRSVALTLGVAAGLVVGFAPSALATAPPHQKEACEVFPANDSRTFQRDVPAKSDVQLYVVNEDGSYTALYDYALWFPEAGTFTHPELNPGNYVYVVETDKWDPKKGNYKTRDLVCFSVNVTLPPPPSPPPVVVVPPPPPAPPVTVPGTPTATPLAPARPRFLLVRNARKSVNFKRRQFGKSVVFTVRVRLRGNTRRNLLISDVVDTDAFIPTRKQPRGVVQRNGVMKKLIRNARPGRWYAMRFRAVVVGTGCNKATARVPGKAKDTNRVCLRVTNRPAPRTGGVTG